jgi:hypothetical protein
MTILYACEPALTAQEFCDVLISSALAERRPVEDLERLAQMLLHADIIITARSNGRLVGSRGRSPTLRTAAICRTLPSPSTSSAKGSASV